MKKLSFNNSSIKTNSSVGGLNTNVSEYIYADDFSGFILDNGIKVKGACCFCEDKPCLKYSSEEVTTTAFRCFPHNTDYRVCPTNAITINSNQVTINQNCIMCGLCVSRCPFAAIQFSPIKMQCKVNQKSDIVDFNHSIDEQKKQVLNLKLTPYKCSFRISNRLSEEYTNAIRRYSKLFPDLSEVIVRNSLINLGIKCNVNAQGNQHNRIEFFAEEQNNIIIGESASTESDTLAITRRILDDLAVLISRYGFEKGNILPLSVINGFPNKRVDYYEVVADINNILNVQVCTITYHILFVLNLLRIKLSSDILKTFYIDKDNMSALSSLKKLIPNIEIIDSTVESSNNYKPYK